MCADNECWCHWVPEVSCKFCGLPILADELHTYYRHPHCHAYMNMEPES